MEHKFFFLYFYFIIIFSIIFFIIPLTKNLNNINKFKNISFFEYILGTEILKIFYLLLILLILINLSWSSYSLSNWFGHIIFASFQYKISYFFIFFFYMIILIYCNSFYISHKEIYDYFVINLNLFLWINFLFYANTLFTVIFLIEILSTLVFLLLITSTFSTTYYYNNLNLNIYNYFFNAFPFFFLQTLMYFFWISLIASLNLFFSLILIYINFFTFDWFIFEYIFFFLISIKQFKDLFFLMIIWFNFLFCIFLKCGLVPFYFWKPSFFKGIPLNAFFFYITFFYFFIFLFFIVFFLIYVSEIFYFFLIINIFTLMVGFMILLCLMLESFYLKTFLAISSILNTLFIFLTLNNINFYDFFFLFN